MFEELTKAGFECFFASHAIAILERDFPEAGADIQSVLSAIAVPITEIVGSGGGETKGTQRMRRAFAEAGWQSKNYEIQKIINGEKRESTSHEVDHAKAFVAGEIALEIEWNNKDPFFDRDLENFKRLHAEGAISLGIIVTRGTSLHRGMFEFLMRFARERGVNSFADLDRLGIELTRRKRDAIQKRTTRKRSPLPFPEAWSSNFVSDKYGEATTHWRKLMDRVQRGVGNPCPLIFLGIPAQVISFPTESDRTVADAIQAAAEENSGESIDLEQ